MTAQFFQLARYLL